MTTQPIPITKHTFYDMFFPFRDNLEERKLLVSWCKHFVDRGIKVRVTLESNLTIPELSKNGACTTVGKSFRLWVNYNDHMEVSQVGLDSAGAESIVDFERALEGESIEWRESNAPDEDWSEMLKKRFTEVEGDDD